MKIKGLKSLRLYKALAVVAVRSNVRTKDHNQRLSKRSQGEEEERIASKKEEEEEDWTRP